MANSTDLTFEMVAHDKNVAETMDILADGFGEMAVILRRTAQRLRAVQVEADL